MLINCCSRGVKEDLPVVFFGAALAVDEARELCAVGSLLEEECSGRGLSRGEEVWLNPGLLAVVIILVWSGAVWVSLLPHLEGSFGVDFM